MPSFEPLSGVAVAVYLLILLALVVLTIPLVLARRASGGSRPCRSLPPRSEAAGSGLCSSGRRPRRRSPRDGGEAPGWKPGGDPGDGRRSHRAGIGPAPEIPEARTTRAWRDAGTHRSG